MITKADFKIKYAGDIPYYEYTEELLDITIVIEPCLNGFDVKVFDKEKNIINSPVCTNINYIDDGPGRKSTVAMRSFNRRAWLAALMIANDIHKFLLLKTHELRKR